MACKCSIRTRDECQSRSFGISRLSPFFHLNSEWPSDGHRYTRPQAPERYVRYRVARGKPFPFGQICRGAMRNSKQLLRPPPQGRVGAVKRRGLAEGEGSACAGKTAGVRYAHNTPSRELLTGEQFLAHSAHINRRIRPLSPPS